MRLALLELSNVIFKLGFSRALDEMVNGDTENNMCIDITVYLLCFSWKSNNCVHQVQVVMPNSIF